MPAIQRRRQLVVVWKDSLDQRATTFYTTLDSNAADFSAPEQAFLSNLRDISGCKMEGAWAHEWLGFDYTPPPSPYGRVTDRVLITGHADDRSPVRLLVPGPVSSILQPDLTTVDMDSPALAPLLASGIVSICGIDGQPVVSWLRGKRWGVQVGRAARV